MRRGQSIVQERGDRSQAGPGQGTQGRQVTKSMHSAEQTGAGSKGSMEMARAVMDKAFGSELTAAAAGQRLLRAWDVVRVGSSSVAVTPRARQFMESCQQPPAFDWRRAGSKTGIRARDKLMESGGTYWHWTKPWSVVHPRSCVT